MASIINASSTGSGGIVQTADASGILQLQNNGTVAVTVSNGAVGIGTASPAALLHVSSTTNRSYAIIQSTATTAGPEAGIQLNCANRNFYFFNNYDTQTLDSYDATGAAFVLRQGRAGYTTALQGATPVVGTGITFPATQSASSDANTLDDYEEGTFTPTITSQTGSITSYNAQGQYTKVGRLVYVILTINLTTVGTAGGTLVFASLPFTTTSARRPNVSVAREDASTGVYYGVYVDSSSTVGVISSFTFGGIVWTNGYTYVVSFMYPTA